MPWNVAVRALIVGGVERDTLQADLFATVDRSLAERAHAERAHAERPLAEQDPIIITSRITVRSRLLDPMSVTGEGSLARSGRVLPPLQPRIIPRDPVVGPGGVRWDKSWNRHAYVRSLTERTVYSTAWDHGVSMRVLPMRIECRGKIDEVIQLAFPLDGVLREINTLTSTFLTQVAYALLAAGLGGAFLTDRSLRPGIRLEAIDPAAMVPGTGSELTRRFTNLLENAVRHTPLEGTVTVSALVDAQSVTVTVTDTGEGIGAGAPASPRRAVLPRRCRSVQ